MVTETQYTEAMQRHGTPDWTDEDARVQQEWSEQVKESDRKKAYRAAVERAERGVATDEDNRLIDQYADKYGGGEDVSRGNNSSASDSEHETSTGNGDSSDQSPVPTTENPSSKDQTGDSSVTSTGGTKTTTPTGGKKK